MRDKHQNRIFWAIIATETSHLFCCVLPTVFSIASLLAGFGVIVTLPGWLNGLHHALHSWEMPMLVMSAVVVVLGWALHYYSLKNDCHDVGECSHAPCGPTKRRASKILIGATILLGFNLLIYFGLHREETRLITVTGEISQDIHELEGHDHSHHDH